MGPKGKGRGGLAPEQQARMGFQSKRGKIHTQKGAIIGRFLVEGDQIRGQVDHSFAEIVSAAEREASDRISRDRIPRQYHKAIKDYFSNVQRSAQTLQEKQRGDPVAKPDSSAPKESANQSQDPKDNKD